ncbi:MAG: hypothetical protein J6P38_00250 [Acetobacter sp.]|nr:hypothetical protein [Acetobacter sp.]
MERREKIQGFIKKYIILKKRKPTDSIFAEKRSAVAITFGLLLPVFLVAFFVTLDICALYYADEVLSMGLDGAATLLSAVGYEQAMNNSSVQYNAQILLGTGYCQYMVTNVCFPPSAGYSQLFPSNVSNYQWVKMEPAYGGVIQAKGYLTGFFTGFGLSNFAKSGVTATSVVRFLSQ